MDYDEFRLFAFAAIDFERELQKKNGADEMIKKAQQEQQILAKTRGRRNSTGSRN